MAPRPGAGSIVGMTRPILTSPAVRGFVGALVAAILAATFVPLGLTFVLVGLTPLGVVFLGVGAVCAAAAPLFIHAGRRDVANEEAARTGRAAAVVLDARLREHSRIGARHPLRLAVSIGGTRAARTLYVIPSVDFRPGSSIDVAFAPADPDNFLPLG
jgi:hypothetical protein